MITEELWEAIKTSLGREVSNFGNVRNAETNYYYKPYQEEEKDYFRIIFDGNKKLVHELVAEYFVPKPQSDKKLIVHHINGIKTDNRAENLEWTTQSRNVEEWWKQRNYTNPVGQYKKSGELVKVWKTVKEATQAGFNKNSIYSCCCGNLKTYKSFVWKYLNEGRAVSQPKIDNEEVKQNYVEIGKIKKWDFSGNYIHKDGSKIIGTSGKLITITFRGKYGRVHLLDTERKRHPLTVSKIINQVLKGGKYEDEVDHVDENKKNNSPPNLESVTHRENVIRAMGKAVNQINKETGEVIESFRTITDACKKLGNHDVSAITSICNGMRKIAYGFKWEWVKKLN
jgi:HNH endonuclease